MTTVARFEVEKFDDNKVRGSLWQRRVKTLLAKEELFKVLHAKKSKSHGMADADWEDMNFKAMCTIELCLAYEVMYNVMDEI